MILNWSEHGVKLFFPAPWTWFFFTLGGSQICLSHKQVLEFFLRKKLWSFHFLKWINASPFRNTQTKTSDPPPIQDKNNRKWKYQTGSVTHITAFICAQSNWLPGVWFYGENLKMGKDVRGIEGGKCACSECEDFMRSDGATCGYCVRLPTRHF